MKLLFVTDAYDPQVNGVVVTIKNLIKVLEDNDHTIELIEPSQFFGIHVFVYPELKWSLDLWRVGPMIRASKPDAIHIFTEGMLGLAARLYCEWAEPEIPFTTSYHTRFPEFFNMYFHIPLTVSYGVINWFHSKAQSTLVPTPSMMDFMKEKVPNANWKLWTRGVNPKIYYPEMKLQANCLIPDLVNLKRPILLCVSRVSLEKGLDDFCQLKTSGTKVVVGDGPSKKALEAKYPDVVFTGAMFGSKLASVYAYADCFVFPSRVDTFGNVMIESMASGTPIAGYRVTGPKDVLIEGVSGYMLDEGLEASVNACLKLDRQLVHEASQDWTIESCVAIFTKNLHRLPIDFWQTNALYNQQPTSQSLSKRYFKRLIYILEIFFLAFYTQYNGKNVFILGFISLFIILLNMLLWTAF
jgi:glycosyltransferase involved in cell wall biosynthesis